METTRAVPDEAYARARKQRVRFVVAFASSEYRTYAGLSKLVDVSEEVKKWSPNDLPERMRGILAGISSDIRFVDLTPVFRSEAEKGALLFIPDDIHWAPAAHRLVAETLHNALASHAAGLP